MANNQLPPLPGDNQEKGGSKRPRLQLGQTRQSTSQQPPAAQQQPVQPQYVQPQQPQYREPNYERERVGKGRGCGCRAIGCGLAVFLLVIVVGLIYLIISRPPQIVDPIKQWLNADLQQVAVNPEVRATAREDLSQQVDNFNTGDNQLVISEQQLNVLLDDSTGNSRISADIEPEQLKLFLDLTPESSVPLWGVAKFGTVQRDGATTLALNGIGTERISSPDILNDILLDAFLSTGNFLSQGQTEDVLDFFVVLPNNVTVKDIELSDDQMVVTLNVSTGLDGIFN